jgi:CheY-like chemotaxis protein
MTSRTFLVALLTLALLAPPAAAQQRRIKQDRTHITAEELAEQVGQNGYEVVEKLRPDWLRRSERRISLDQGRATETGGMYTDVSTTPLRLTVFVDQTEMGGLEELRRLRNDEIREIEYLTGSDAQQRYGARFSAGIIHVVLKNQ